MIEPEVAYLDLNGLMDLAEAFLTHILRYVLEHHRADLTTIGRDVTKLEAVLAPHLTPSQASTLGEEGSELARGSASAAAHAFPRLTYEEAHAMLDEAYKAGKLEH